MRRLLNPFLITLLAASASVAARQRAPEQIIVEAVKLHQAGDIKSAIPLYREYLDLRPMGVKARANLGAAYAALALYQEAIEEYERALRLDSYNPTVRFNLGLAYFRTNQIPKAAEEFDKVVAAEPGNRKARLLVADCYLRMDEPKRVIELLSSWESAHQEDRTVSYLLGTALIRDGQLEQGQKLVDRIFRGGDSAEGRMMLGMSRMAIHNYRDAVKDFERAVELNPRLPGAHSSLGQAYLATGNRDGAMRAFQKEIELNPYDFHSNLHLGILSKQNREFGDALDHLNRALQVRPGSPSVRYQIGNLHVSSRNYKEARIWLEDLVKEYPNFVEAHVSLATVYARLGLRDDANRHLQIVRRLNEERQNKGPKTGAEPKAAYSGVEVAEIGKPDRTPAPEAAPASFDAVASRASLAREENRLEEAIGLYQEATGMRPSWAEGWWYLGTLQYDRGHFWEARKALEELVRLQPKAGAGWAMLGLSQFELREYEEAFESLRRARALGVPTKSELNAVSRFRLGLLLNRFGHSAGAVQVLYTLAREKGENPAILTALGLAALAKPSLPGEVPEDQMDLVVKAGRAHFFMANHHPKEAVAAIRELIGQYPEAPGLHLNLGIFLIEQEPDAALEEFRRELEISPSQVDARLHIAFEYLKRGEAGKGLPYAEEAVKLAPQNFAGRNALGRILLETGQTERAIEELERGRDLAPDSPQMYFALGRAYLRAGRKEDATKANAEFKRLEDIRRAARESQQASSGEQPPG